MSNDKTPSTLTCALVGLGSAAAVVGVMHLIAGKKSEKIGVVRTVEDNIVDLQVSSSQTDRTKLKKFIQDHWQGKPLEKALIYATQYIKLGANGRITSTGHNRDDIGVLQFSDQGQFLFNVFIEPDGSNRGPNSDRVKVTHEEQYYIDKLVARWVRDNASFVARQRRWFDEEPWTHLNDLTREEAVQKLSALGW